LRIVTDAQLLVSWFKGMENSMKVSLKQINGPWDQGWVLDKHMVSSTFLGNDDRGHPCFDNQRTEIGEATYQLKYQKD